MVTFFCCIIFLIAGYFVYGKFVENKLFKTDPNRPTPCKTLGDGVDYKEMKTWKVFVIQFLNIAGLGIAYHAKPLVKKNAQHAISTTGLDAILYLMGFRERDIE